MSQIEGVSKPNTLDNLVHGFVESVAHEHEHQIDHLKETPNFAAGNVNKLTQQHTESSIGQRIHVPQLQQLTSLKEDQLLEETTTTLFSDFSFLPERSTIAQSAKSLIIDSYELANETLAVVRIPPKSKRLFSAALLVANATHRSVSSLTSDSGSKDTLSVKETKPLAFPVGFNETVIACAPAAVTNLKKQKKSRGTSRLNAVLKETLEEDTVDSVDHRFKMIQRRLDRISPKRMHTCRDSDSGCSVDDPSMYKTCYTFESGVRDNLNNIIELANLNSEPVQHYSTGESEDGDSDLEEEVIRNEIFEEDIFEDLTVVDHLIETKMTEKKHIPKKKIKKKNHQIFPTSLFRKKMLSKLDAEIEKRERFMKEYLRVATLPVPHVVVVLYCRWNPGTSDVCGQTTELIIYTMKAFFTTNNGLHVNWIHSPEEKFERLIERGARMKFYKDYPENVCGVLALSRDASILVKNPQSSLLHSLCELLGISRHELAVVEVKVQ